jgi:hypothetical protein
VWNHTFFWESMKPNGGGEPTGKLGDAIKASFGSLDEFKTQFKNAGGDAAGCWGVERRGASREAEGSEGQHTPRCSNRPVHLRRLLAAKLAKAGVAAGSDPVWDLVSC